MKLKFRIRQSWLLVTAPFAAIAIAASPTNAASLAFSKAQTILAGELSSPTSTEPFAAEAKANSSAAGNGTDFQNLARSAASTENLFLSASQTAPIRFGFDFFALLALGTAIDNPSLELARATGAISLALYDVTDGVETLLDSLNITVLGNLNTPGSGDRLKIRSTGDNLTLLPNLTDTRIGGRQEFAVAEVGGTYSRTFDRPTSLRLVQRVETKACVQAPQGLGSCGRAVPEPSNTVALLMFVATTGGMVWFRSRKPRSVLFPDTEGAKRK
ncbi:MAG: hypothetical protein KME43_25905 [Myxacorys chilensis ATA2-1-KO14]|jgi:hypothetical protein|nr:hypothetical protein [Myxacorys chilensis ATA2-1-KO14]